VFNLRLVSFSIVEKRSNSCCSCGQVGRFLFAEGASLLSCCVWPLVAEFCVSKVVWLAGRIQGQVIFAGRVPLVAACLSLGKSCLFDHELGVSLWLRGDAETRWLLVDFDGRIAHYIEG
jgi:hypothetical protein